MTNDDLIAEFRVESDDFGPPPISSDDQLLVWLGEAQTEAAIRARLLYEDSDAAICDVAFTTGQTTRPLHEAVIEVTHARWVPTSDPACTINLVLKDRLELDKIDPDWRSRTGEPEFLVHDDERVRLVPPAPEAGIVRIECTRLPENEVFTDGSQTPEIAGVHHRHLVQWALYRHFSRPDADTEDKDRAARALANFTLHFGPPVDAEMRRSLRQTHDCFNQVYL